MSSGALRTVARAKGARERRDVVSGEARDEAGLIRFVAGPDHVIAPDLGRKLHGRGLWVAANRAAVEAATRKGLFSRAAKRPLTSPPDLADQVDTLLRRRLLAGLGLARKGGEVVLGFEKVKGAIAQDKVAFMIEAVDGAEDGRRKLAAALARRPHRPRLIGLFTTDELSLALGAENVIHSALLVGRGAERWAIDVERIAGFRPLFPDGWGFGSDALESRGEEP